MSIEKFIREIVRKGLLYSTEETKQAAVNNEHDSKVKDNGNQKMKSRTYCLPIIIALIGGVIAASILSKAGDEYFLKTVLGDPQFRNSLNSLIQRDFMQYLLTVAVLAIEVTAIIKFKDEPSKWDVLRYPFFAILWLGFYLFALIVLRNFTPSFIILFIFLVVLIEILITIFYKQFDDNHAKKDYINDFLIVPSKFWISCLCLLLILIDLKIEVYGDNINNISTLANIVDSLQKADKNYLLELTGADVFDADIAVTNIEVDTITRSADIVFLVESKSKNPDETTSQESDYIKIKSTILKNKETCRRFVIEVWEDYQNDFSQRGIERINLYNNQTFDLDSLFSNP